MIFTGPVDEFFDFRFGKLPYRSLNFQFETHDTKTYQTAPVINYPNDYAYTRVTEFKYLTGQEHNKSTIVYEFPQDEGDPYYPVPRRENAELYKRYSSLAEQTPDVHFAGRLATYKYYNMDQVVAQALTLFNKIAAAREVTDPEGRDGKAIFTRGTTPKVVAAANGNGSSNGHEHYNRDGQTRNGNGHVKNGNGHASNGKARNNGKATRQRPTYKNSLS